MLPKIMSPKIMSPKSLAVFAVSLALAACLPLAHAAEPLPPPDPAIAAMTPDQMVAARKAAMKEDGGILQKAGQLDGAGAVAAATSLLTNFSNFPALFAEGSATPESHALPAIWENFDEFKGIFLEGQADAADMLAAAKSGDMEAFDAAAQALSQTCGQCHQSYRGHV